MSHHTDRLFGSLESNQGNREIERESSEGWGGSHEINTVPTNTDDFLLNVVKVTSVRA